MNENPTILPGGAASNSSDQQGATGWAIGRGPKDPRGDGELRGEAEDLAGLPRGSLSTIRFGFPDAFVPGDVERGRVDFEELEAEERYQFIHAPSDLQGADAAPDVSPSSRSSIRHPPRSGSSPASANGGSSLSCTHASKRGATRCPMRSSLHWPSSRERRG